MGLFGGRKEGLQTLGLTEAQKQGREAFDLDTVIQSRTNDPFRRAPDRGDVNAALNSTEVASTQPEFVDRLDAGAAAAEVQRSVELQEQREEQEAVARPSQLVEKAQVAVVQSGAEAGLNHDQVMQVARPETLPYLANYAAETRSFGAKLKDKVLNPLWESRGTLLAGAAGAAFKSAVRFGVKRGLDIGTFGASVAAGAAAV
jgi:hypothetical protein